MPCARMQARSAPWSPRQIDALAELLQGLSHEEIARRRAATIASGSAVFDRATQQHRMQAFVEDLLARDSRAG